MAKWRFPLLRFYEDMDTCVFVLCSPYVVFGKNAEKVGEDCYTCGLAYNIPILNYYAATKVRGLIREKRGIEGSCGRDLLVTVFCRYCALIQEAREVEWEKDGQVIDRE